MRTFLRTRTAEAESMTEPALLPRPQLRRMLRKARRADNQSTAPGRSRPVQAIGPDPLSPRKHISLYLPTDGEIDPRLLLREAQRRGKATYLPVLSAWPRTKMVFQRIRPGEKLKPNRFRILEPRANLASNARSGRWIWCCCRWWGLTMSAGAWGWAAVSMIAAWRIWRAVKLAQADAAGSGP
jgi:hypothetical protein